MKKITSGTAQEKLFSNQIVYVDIKGKKYDLAGFKIEQKGGMTDRVILYRDTENELQEYTLSPKEFTEFYINE